MNFIKIQRWIWLDETVSFHQRKMEELKQHRGAVQDALVKASSCIHQISLFDEYDGLF